MKLKALITGAHGQLGQALLRSRPAHWAVTALGSAQLDITDIAAVRRHVSELRPDVILNAAAYNAVDKAEQEGDRAFAVNAQGPLNLARAANETGARLVHVSTDYVFDGHTSEPYDEHAEPRPLNAYGESKLQGERWVLQEQPGALLVRTAWVYSAAANNFVAAMLRAAQLGEQLRVVDDQVGAPTFAGDLAHAITNLVAHPDAAGGLYHYTGATALSRYDFARAIFEIADTQADDEEPGRYVRLLSRIRSSEYPSAAARPAYSVLDCGKIARMGIEPRPLMESLPEVVRELLLSFKRSDGKHGAAR